MLEAIIIVCLLTIFYLGFHLVKKVKLINESLFATTVGMLTGFVLWITNSKQIIQEVQDIYVIVFLVVLLPPIIFERYFLS